MSAPRLALVVTAKNECRLLRRSLLYHHFIGVERCYVFDDGSTDGTPDSLGGLPFVELHLRAEPAAPIPPGARAENFYVLRQEQNTRQALALACAAGFHWLIALDADELIAPDLTRASRGLLREAFAALPPNVEQVRFPTLEVVGRQPEYHDVFREETLFKRNNAKLMRPLPDPAGKKRRASGFFGHRIGKSAVRLNQPAMPNTSHGFRRADGTPLHTQAIGHLLHYYSFDYTQFRHRLETLRSHPDHYANGTPVEYVPKRMWRDMINQPGITDAFLRDYHARWVMFSPAEVARLRAARRFGFLPQEPKLVEVLSARHAFEQIARLPEYTLPGDTG
jgi:glycosyltransferase involved in cell wall biosynthesis